MFFPVYVPVGPCVTGISTRAAKRADRFAFLEIDLNAAFPRSGAHNEKLA